MSGVPTAAEIISTQHVRDYIQFGGARPSNLPHYYGQDAQYMIVDSMTVVENGAVAPVYVPDPVNTGGRYRLVARTISAPGSLPKSTLTLLEKHGSVPRQLARVGVINLYENVGFCKDPSDFLGGWSDYVLIYSYGITETKTPGKRGDWKASTEIADKLAVTNESIYAIGAMGFGEKYLDTYKIASVCYGSFIQTGDCGAPDDGTQRIYALAIHGGTSPLVPAHVEYSLDGGATWASTGAITGMLSTTDPDRVRIMGNYLIVTASVENAYYYTALSSVGAPTTWTKVTTGIVTGKGPTDITVMSPREAYLCGLGGYIYKMTDPTAGLTVLDAGVATTVALARIDSQDNVIVAVGATHTVIVSTNRGTTWAATTTSPGVVDCKCVSIVSPGLIWVGDSAGALYSTQNGGVNWTQQTQITGLTVVSDVQFVTKEVGFAVGAITGPFGRVWATWNGGYSWTNTSPRIQNVLTVQGINEIATPQVASSDPSIASDNIALACLGDAGVTGAVVIGSAAMV